jgi:hypothetical protein
VWDDGAYCILLRKSKDNFEVALVINDLIEYGIPVNTRFGDPDYRPESYRAQFAKHLSSTQAFI